MKISLVKIITEGKAKIIVKEGVFYNPAAKLSRDIGVAFLASIGEILGRKLKVCEPLAATGVRGTRYALETSVVEKIILNDKLRIAYENILENIKLNELEGIAYAENKDANLLLEEHATKGRRFDFIDIDPFGPPLEFLQPAIRALAHKGFLAVCATDTAALCGVAKRACIRKYSSIPLRNEFMNETGIRILIAACIRIAAYNEAALEPVFCHYTAHYMRAYFRMYLSTSKTDSILKKLGYLSYCENCLWRGTSSQIEEVVITCPDCNSKTRIAGPLYLGEIYNEEIVEKMKNNAEGEAHKLVSLISEEVNLPPFYYTLDSFASKLKMSEPRIADVIKILKEKGFKASRTHFSPKGIKTNANFKEFVSTLKNLKLNEYPSSRKC